MKIIPLHAVANGAQHAVSENVAASAGSALADHQADGAGMDKDGKENPLQQHAIYRVQAGKHAHVFLPLAHNTRNAGMEAPAVDEARAIADSAAMRALGSLECEMPGFDVAGKLETATKIRKDEADRDFHFLKPALMVPHPVRTDMEDDFHKLNYRVEVGSASLRMQNNLAKAAESAGKQYEKEYWRKAQDTVLGNPEKLLKFFNDMRGSIETQGNDLAVAHAIGERPSMEDKHIAEVIEVTMGGKPYRIQVQGIFDGHGGSAGAAFSSARLGKYLCQRLEEFNPEKITDTGMYNALSLALVDLSYAYPGRDGTTANISMVVDHTLYVASTGDSRAILLKGGAKTDGDTAPQTRAAEIVQLSDDGNPDNPRMARGVENRGGEVWDGRADGYGLTNALGDHGNHLNPRPKVTQFKLPQDPEERKDWKLLQVCDGLTDVASTDQLGKALIASLAKNNSLANAVGELVATAHGARSTDNLSAMVTSLQPLTVADQDHPLPLRPATLPQLFGGNHPAPIPLELMLDFSALTGNLEAVQTLIHRIFKEAPPDARKLSRLLKKTIGLAAANSHEPVLAWLKKLADAKLKQRDRISIYTDTLIREATLGNVQMTRLLTGMMEQTPGKTNIGADALRHAINNHHVEVAGILIDNLVANLEYTNPVPYGEGISLDEMDFFDCTYAEFAAQLGHDDIVDMLIAKGARSPLGA